MPNTLDYAIYADDVRRWEEAGFTDYGADFAYPQLARIASRRVAWAVAVAWRQHMEVYVGHALPTWLQSVLEAQAPD